MESDYKPGNFVFNKKFMLNTMKETAGRTVNFMENNRITIYADV